MKYQLLSESKVLRVTLQIYFCYTIQTYQRMAYPTVD